MSAHAAGTSWTNTETKKKKKKKRDDSQSSSTASWLIGAAARSGSIANRDEKSARKVKQRFSPPRPEVLRAVLTALRLCLPLDGPGTQVLQELKPASGIYLFVRRLGVLLLLFCFDFVHRKYKCWKCPHVFELEAECGGKGLSLSLSPFFFFSNLVSQGGQTYRK